MSQLSVSDLRQRRDALARELAELQSDLGGLAYEMAIRDHFRLDVLVRQAGRLQEVDAQLSEVEHLLGACPHCGTLHPAVLESGRYATPSQDDAA